MSCEWDWAGGEGEYNCAPISMPKKGGDHSATAGRVPTGGAVRYFAQPCGKRAVLAIELVDALGAPVAHEQVLVVDEEAGG